MKNKNVSQIVSHLFNGNVEAEIKFIEIEGKKYLDDGTGKAKLGEDGQPIPFVEKKADDINPAEADLETLAKINPLVAALLDSKKKNEEILTQKQKEEKEKLDTDLKEKGEWQKLADTRAIELEEAKKLITQKDELLGKYKGSVEAVLKELMATIPKENLSLIPPDFSPRQKLEYITQNAKLLGAKMTGVNKGDGVNKSDDTPAGTEEEKLVKEIDELIKKGDKKTKTELDILFEKSKKLKELRMARMKEEEDRKKKN